MTKEKNDFDEVFSDFDTVDDFEFLLVQKKSATKAIVETDQTVETYKEKMKDLEALVLPFFNKLLKTADQAYIHWPNRGPQIELQIKKILHITRS